MQSSLTQTAAIKGTITTGDTLTIAVNDPALSGGPENVLFCRQSGDSLGSIATKLAAAITADRQSASNRAKCCCSVEPDLNEIDVSKSNILFRINQQRCHRIDRAWIEHERSPERRSISGTVTSGNVLKLTAFDAGLGRRKRLRNLHSDWLDTLNSLATNLASAVNGSSALSGAGITATATQNVVHLKSTSLNLTTYSQSRDERRDRDDLPSIEHERTPNSPSGRKQNNWRCARAGRV